MQSQTDVIMNYLVTTGFSISQEECNKCERLLSAIFGDEPEYYGDGTKAEDEDWEGNEDD